VLTPATLPSDAWKNRHIVTYDRSAHQQIPFAYDSLNDDQKALMDAKPDAPAQSDGYGALRVDYLRGDASHEAVGQVPQFRQRLVVDDSGKVTDGSLLGDIIDSSPVYVKAPPYYYDFNGYPAFKTANANREPMVYVAANDGMVHGFDANASADTGGGKEEFAYIPSSLFGKPASGDAPGVPQLSQLTSPSYGHEYMADGQLTVADACWGGTSESCWHSVLAGTLGRGGRGVYALDVTDPTKFSTVDSASSPGKLLLWEFTSDDDDRLGYTLAAPIIARFRIGGQDRWAAIVGNGYNNTNTNGLEKGPAVLFILFLDHGANSSWSGDYVAIPVDTPNSFTGPNGLGPPVVVDTDRDGYVDTIYAGDLAGDLWRFDVSSADTNNWKVAFGGKPLFVATDGTNRQPITDRPTVGYNLMTSAPYDTIVYFGTGRYLDKGDNSSSSQNSFYGIFDEWAADGSPSISRSTMLLHQTLTEVTADGKSCTAAGAGPCALRTVSNGAYPTSGNTYGWYVDLDTGAPSAGTPSERVVTDPVLYSGYILFTTLIPGVTQCDPGGSGWLMVLNASNGGSSTQPTFDLNGDHVVDNGDLIDTSDGDNTGTRTGAAGLYSGNGPMSGLTLMLSSDPNTDERIYTNTQGGNMLGVNSLHKARLGRISWREITAQ
jgi:type IV pilus assembly protein PilY1